MSKQYGNWVVVDSIQGGAQSYAHIVTRDGEENGKRFFLKELKKYEGQEHFTPQQIERFRQEIEVVKSLSHPNILRIEDYNLDHDPPFMVTEYCELGHLKYETVARYSVVERLRIFSAICRGVGAAHTHPKIVVHRDLKPENIFLRDNGTPVVGDFGICFLMADGNEERRTMTGERVGNKFCRPPEFEVSKPEDISPASDVYCLGRLLYWMESGRELYREDFKGPNYDLRKDRKDSAIHFIYELLGQMIIEKSSRRLSDADKVADAVEQIIRRIEEEAHVIDLDVPQLCIYCGIGNYTVIVNPYIRGQYPSQQSNMHMFLHIQVDDDIQREAWLVFACNYCGNVQIFRPDKAELKNRDVWKKAP